MPMSPAERQARYRARRKQAAEDFAVAQSKMNENNVQIFRIQQEMKIEPVEIKTEQKVYPELIIECVPQNSQVTDEPLPEIPKIEVCEDPESLLIRCLTPAIPEIQEKRKPNKKVSKPVNGRQVREKDKIYARNTRRNAKTRLLALPPEVQKLLIEENKRKQRERSQKYRMRKRGIIKANYAPFDSKDEYVEIMARVRFSLPEDIQQRRMILKQLLKECYTEMKQNAEESGDTGAHEEEDGSFSYDSFDQTQFLEVTLSSPEGTPIKQEPEENIADYVLENS